MKETINKFIENLNNLEHNTKNMYNELGISYDKVKEQPISDTMIEICNKISELNCKGDDNV